MSHRPECEHIWSNWEPKPCARDGTIYLWHYCLIPGCHTEEWEFEKWEQAKEAA